jgi:hypothetical protein
MLCKILGESEIYLVEVDLGCDKAPRTNSMNGLFHKTYWTLLKQM